MPNINITDTNSFKTWLGTVPEADRLKAAQFVCGVWVAVTLPSIMHAFGEQLDQNDQIVKKALQRTLIAAFYGMSTYMVTIQQSRIASKKEAKQLRIPEIVNFDEGWFTQVDLIKGKLKRCHGAVKNYLGLINHPRKEELISIAGECVAACASLLKEPNDVSYSWSKITSHLNEMGEYEFSDQPMDKIVGEILNEFVDFSEAYASIVPHPFLEDDFTFWYGVYDSWYRRPTQDPIDWRSLLAAFNSHSHYINSVISIEPTNKLLKEAYNSYQHMFRADNAYQRFSEQKDLVGSKNGEIARLRSKNTELKNEVDELAAKFREKTATEELGGVLEAWEDRARSAAWSSRGNLILILIVIIALVAGALYVIVCVGFGWLDALLIPDGCVNLGDEICVGLTQRTAFLTVIFLTLASVIFLVLRILLRGYNSNIFWRDDARERIAFATVYINMLGNARTSQKTDDYARIVYETLFRPANSKLPLEDVSVGLSIPDNLAKNLIKQ